MVNYVLKKILGTKNEREVKKLRPLVARVAALEPRMKALSDADFPRLVSGWKAIDATEKRLIVLQAQVNVLRREIGLTPSSRSAVKVPQRKPEESTKDRAARYMSAIRGGRA